MGKKTGLRRSTRNRKVETSSSEEEEEELEVQEEHGGSSSDEQNSDDDDDGASSASENEEEDALQADGYGDDDSEDDDDSEGDDDDDASDDGEREEKEIYTGDESCTLDLRNLTAINSHQVNTATLYKSQADNKKKGTKGKKKNDLMAAAAMGDKLSATIPPTDTTTIINEDQLLETAREGCQQILRGLWSLETERTDAGPMGLLPQQFEIKTPRELVRGVGDVRRRWTFYLCAACAILSRLLFHFSLPP